MFYSKDKYWKLRSTSFQEESMMKIYWTKNITKENYINELTPLKIKNELNQQDKIIDILSLMLEQWKIRNFVSLLVKNNRDFYESTSEKEVDIKEAQEILLSGQYIVNISTKGKKTIATIHDAKTANDSGIEFDTERGDINTDNIDIAEKYKSIVESEWLQIAMDWFKSMKR